MNILGVTQTSYEGGIEFADLDSVKYALKVFATGGTPAARETSRLGFDNSPAGGFGLMMKTLIDDSNESRFMQDLFGAVDQVTDEHRMHKSYDYDGVGPFFKTTVEVQKVKVESLAGFKWKFVYLLSLNAAYVGDQPCAGLATTLGADRALWRDEVVIEVAPFGDDMFAFDFDVVADRLASIGLSGVSGTEIAQHIIKHAESADYEKRTLPIRLRDDDIVVDFGITPYSVEGPVDRETRKVVWHWRRPTAVITGPLGRGYEGEKYSRPRLYASISVPEPKNSRSWDRKPVLDPTVKQAIHQQAAAIVGAFQ